jgi:hypothetical protein
VKKPAKRKPWIEIRDPDDEIVCRSGLVHVERMANDHIWIRFSHGKQMVHLDLYAQAKIIMRVMREKDG